METLWSAGFQSTVYGSVVRGDVTVTSDLDVFIPAPVSTQMVEFALREAGFPVHSRVLVQATPSYAVKAYIYLSETDTVSIPLIRLKRDELAFYSLAGSLNLEELKKGMRRPGINKDLMVILPNETGHYEFPALRNVDEAAKILKVDADILRNRLRVLVRRREVGKTGVFKTIMLQEGQVFEEFLEQLRARNPALRRRLRSAG